MYADPVTPEKGIVGLLMTFADNRNLGIGDVSGSTSVTHKFDDVTRFTGFQGVSEREDEPNNVIGGIKNMVLLSFYTGDQAKCKDHFNPPAAVTPDAT